MDDTLPTLSELLWAFTYAFLLMATIGVLAQGRNYLAVIVSILVSLGLIGVSLFLSASLSIAPGFFWLAALVLPFPVGWFAARLSLQVKPMCFVWTSVGWLWFVLLSPILFVLSGVGMADVGYGTLIPAAACVATIIVLISTGVQAAIHRIIIGFCGFCALMFPFCLWAIGRIASQGAALIWAVGSGLLIAIIGVWCLKRFQISETQVAVLLSQPDTTQ